MFDVNSPFDISYTEDASAAAKMFCTGFVKKHLTRKSYANFDFSPSPNADPLIKKAIKEMYKDSKDVNNRDGHFVKRNQHIADYFKSVDSFVKQKIQKPFFNL